MSSNNDYYRPEPARKINTESFRIFVGIVEKLRKECPWDQKQTHETLRHLLIEETYETIEAIDNEDWQELKKELGDVLLHIIFHAVLAEEAGTFTLDDVFESQAEKLIRRHPHVYGDTDVNDADEVLANWEQIKLKEKGRKSVLDGVPKELPSLLRAFRMQDKAAGVGFDFPDRDESWKKVEEELAEYQETISQNMSIEEKEAEFGDLIFALVNEARFQGINPENALRQTNKKFTRRFQYVETGLKSAGRTFKDSTLEEMDVYWDEAKEKGL